MEAIGEVKKGVDTTKIDVAPVKNDKTKTGKTQAKQPKAKDEGGKE